MRRKRFKHEAYILCHMFCGWQLYADLDRLVKLHNGNLILDILNQKCFFNNIPIETLNIVSSLNIWLQDDLRTNKIPLDAIDEAILEIEINIFKDPKSRRGVTNIKGDFKCLGKIRSSNDLYFCKFNNETGNQMIIENGYIKIS